MKNEIHKKKILFILSAIIIIILFTLSYIKIKLKQNSIEINEEPLVNVSENNKQEEDITKLFYVDIKGEVKNPNVYKIDENKRIIDVINQAGGLTEEADTSIINLSKKVKDEMTIIIYSKSEVEEANKKNEIISSIVDNTDCNCPPLKNDGCLNNEVYEEKSNTKISLTNATKEELMTVPGLGETKANAIIEYRNKVGFTSVEDLLNITGIGQATFDKIKEYFIL